MISNDMERYLTFVVPGEPQGKDRPRFARRGKSISTYTPKETHSYERLVRYCAVSAMREKRIRPITVSVSLTIKAYFKIPNSYTKKRREDCLNGDERPSKKPDSDNIAKIVLDGLNPKMKRSKVLHKMVCLQQGLYLDDKQVVSLSVEKWYAEEPRVVVTALWDADELGPENALRW